MAFLEKQTLLNASRDAIDLGLFMNSTADSVALRLLGTTPTLKKIRDDIYTNTGYQVPVLFESGLLIDTPNQTVSEDSVIYAPVIEELPFTTTGVFDADQWYVIQLGEGTFSNALAVVDKASDLTDVIGAVDDGVYMTRGALAVNDGGATAYIYSSGSTLVVDGQFVINGPGSVGRFLKAERDVYDLDFAPSIANNFNITSLLGIIENNFTRNEVCIRLPRKAGITNLRCNQVTFKANLDRFEVLKGNCSITQLDTDEQTMWFIPNLRNLYLDESIDFYGVADSDNYTHHREGLIKIDCVDKVGIGGSIVSKSNFYNTSSAGLVIMAGLYYTEGAGADLPTHPALPPDGSERFYLISSANAFNSVKVSGDYVNSGFIFEAPVLSSEVTATAHNADNYQDHLRRKTRQILVRGVINSQPRITGEYITIYDLQPLAVTNATIYLKSGTKVICEDNQVLRIPTGCKITSNPYDPAMIINPYGTTREGGDGYGGPFTIQGRNITIENLLFDFNMFDVWNTFAYCVSFRVPGYLTVSEGGLYPNSPDHPIKNVLIQNNKFINTTSHIRTPITENNDSWAIDFTSNNGSKLQNIQILRNYCDAGPIQLCGNGTNVGGIDGLEICYNEVIEGHANAIAWSTHDSMGDIKNAIISHNILRRCYGSGIFIGKDGNSLGASKITNVAILDNLIEMNDTISQQTLFADCVLVRSTTGLSGLVIARNTFNVKRPNTSSPAVTITSAKVQASVAFPGTYQFYQNVRIGSSSNPNLTNVTLVAQADVPHAT